MSLNNKKKKRLKWVSHQPFTHIYAHIFPPYSSTSSLYPLSTVYPFNLTKPHSTKNILQK